MDAHVFTLNVFIAETADFTDAQAGGIHEGDHGLLLEVRDGGDEMPCILLRGDKRKIGIEPAHRQLCRVPGQMKDIDGEEAQL